MASVIPNVVIYVTIFFFGCVLSSSIRLAPRIYGGHLASRDEIPYVVSIRNENEHLCGGSILNEQTIVTVAHCVANKTGLVVYAGSTHPTKRNNGDAQDAKVQEIIVHPDYDYSFHTIDNDVALLRLATNLTFNDVVQPIKLIDEDELSDAIDNRKSGIISGWGYGENFFLSKALRSGKVTLLSDEECLDDIQPVCHSFNPEAHICSGPLTGPQIGVGLYDDGGPLVVHNKLAGIILHGEHEDPQKNCHLSSIYARVSHYRDFFNEYITEPPITNHQSKSLLLEFEISLELLNETFRSISNSSFLSGSYLFNYNLWFLGSRLIDSYDNEQTTEMYEGTSNNENYSDVTDSDYTTRDETSRSTQALFEEYQDEYETPRNYSEEDNKPEAFNPEKFILNIQVWNSSPNPEGGISFRLFPNSPLDYYIWISARIE